MNTVERPTPYVGVSGVVDAYQQEVLTGLANQSGLFEQGRELLLGIKATHKTQYLDIENKYGRVWYPVGAEEFSRAIDLNVAAGSPITGVAQVHFDGEHVGDDDYRTHFVRRIVERGGSWLSGIQFDLLPWQSDPTMLSFLETIKEEHGKKIYLQCHKPAMEALGPDGVVRRLGNFATAIDYILFDASHGTGQRMDTAQLNNFLDSAHGSSALSRVGMAVAGGLDALAVREELPRIIERFPDISWDAEGRLHPATPRGTQPLDMRVVREYLQASAAVLEAYSQPAQENSGSGR